MMTHEQRLDRLERIAKLFVKAGLRARSNMRRLDEKIGILIDAQIKGEDRAAELNEKMKTMQMRSDERFRITDERLAKSDERFAKFESQTDQTLKILMEIMRELRNGNSKAEAITR
ncbi:MAG: hypothetical protein WAQ99_18110 [Pyrinomonadaceae bacterium]